MRGSIKLVLIIKLVKIWRHKKVYLLYRYGEKNRPEQILFIATNNWIVLAVPLKYFSVPNSRIFRKSSEEEGENSNSKVLYFTS